MRESVLVYDDESSMRTGFEDIAKDEGCDVTGCETPREVAVALGSGGGYHKAVVDKGALFMPGFIGHHGGLGVARVLVDKFDTLVMIVTGEGFTGVEAIRESGARFFVSKASDNLGMYVRQFIRTGTIQVLPEDVAQAGIL